jgi:RNA polymerase sigma-70 factor (ECF subfamily)
MKDFLLYSDEELISEIKADNMLAFDGFYKKYSKKIYKFGYSILKSSEDAENLVQDVFLNLWENRHKIEKNSSAKSYIFTIAYHSSITLIRRKIRESGFIEHLKSVQEINEKPVNIDLEFNEMSKNLETIINNLPSRQKEIYLLVREERLKHEEIAKRLNISINTVETHMSRALQTIRKKMGKYSLAGILYLFLVT